MSADCLHLLKKEISIREKFEDRIYFPARYFSSVLRGALEEALEDKSSMDTFVGLISKLENIPIDIYSVPSIITSIKFFYLNLWRNDKVDASVAELFNSTVKALVPKVYSLIGDISTGVENYEPAAATKSITYPLEEVEFIFLDENNKVVNLQDLPIKLSNIYEKNGETGIIPLTLLIFENNKPAEFPLPAPEKNIFFDRKSILCFIVLDKIPYISFPLAFREVGAVSTAHCFATTLPRRTWLESERRLSFVVKEIYSADKSSVRGSS